MRSPVAASRVRGLGPAKGRRMLWWRRDRLGYVSQELAPSEVSTVPVRSGRIRRWALAAPLLALVAIAPWLVPWPTSAVSSADPSSLIKAATGESEGGAPLAPTDTTVKDVTKAIARFAVMGYDVPVSADELSSVKTKPGPYQTLGQIRIPAIGLDVTFGEGVSAESLEKGPGHWPGTPLPGRDGNSVISGHRNTHTQPFKYLNLLHPGDKIITQIGNRSPVTYTVVKTSIVPQTKYKDFVLRQPNDDGTRQITLFACHPEGNPINRIVVEGQAG